MCRVKDLLYVTGVFLYMWIVTFVSLLLD